MQFENLLYFPCEHFLKLFLPDGPGEQEATWPLLETARLPSKKWRRTRSESSKRTAALWPWRELFFMPPGFPDDNGRHYQRVSLGHRRLWQTPTFAHPNHPLPSKHLSPRLDLITRLLPTMLAVSPPLCRPRI